MWENSQFLKYSSRFHFYPDSMTSIRSYSHSLEYVFFPFPQSWLGNKTTHKGVSRRIWYKLYSHDLTYSPTASQKQRTHTFIDCFHPAGITLTPQRVRSGFLPFGSWSMVGRVQQSILDTSFLASDPSVPSQDSNEAEPSKQTARQHSPAWVGPFGKQLERGTQAWPSF